MACGPSRASTTTSSGGACAAARGAGPRAGNMIAGVSSQSQYRLGDILANAITHGVGAAFALAGAGGADRAGDARRAMADYELQYLRGTLVLVYVCSTLYHSLVRTRARHVFLVLDHAAIYLLIAGTYTPFMLVSMRGRTGWTLLGVVWTLAVAGVVFKSLAVGRFLPRRRRCTS